MRKENTTMQSFYVYIYLDPRRPGRYQYDTISFLYEPIYVGKGKDNRAMSHIKEVTSWKCKSTNNNIKHNKLSNIIAHGMEPYILYADYGTESDMLLLEESYINQIGQIVDNTGPLTNIRTNGWSNNALTSTYCRKSNGLFGKRFTTMVHHSTNEMIQVDSNPEVLQTYFKLGYKKTSSWSRPLKNTSMSRIGSTNPMHQKSAVKGRKWVTLASGESKLLTQNEILNLTEEYIFGRKVLKNKRKRVIIKGSTQAKYMSSHEIESLPLGTEYQFGLLWKNENKTYQVRR